ncbi:MAG: MoaD/ThiS family protein [Desulfurococcaceae archaeon]|jgi:molybdopterin converting factor small subunit|nr:MoaD/ThiS family protein [Desulfurococcaceae archaeon]
MAVIVRFYGVLKEIINEKLELEVPSDGILFINLINEILQKYAPLSEYIVVTEKGVEVKGVTILVNGRHIMFLGGDKAVVRSGDIIDILPPLHGG